MDVRGIVAKRINNGQSEISGEDKPHKRRTVATSGILYPLRTHCFSEECTAFTTRWMGPAAIPDAVKPELATNFGL
jgi:hypothetical protein